MSNIPAECLAYTGVYMGYKPDTGIAVLFGAVLGVLAAEYIRRH